VISRNLEKHTGGNFLETTQKRHFSIEEKLALLLRFIWQR
jgi:hypothetical protein